MSVIITDDILQAIRMTEDELKLEIAVLLFQKEKLTLAQASHFAGVTRLQFQRLLASRQIPIHYDIKEFDEDLNTLRNMESDDAVKMLHQIMDDVQSQTQGIDPEEIEREVAEAIREVREQKRHVKSRT